MARKALPSQEVLRQLLRYEPDTGNLFWRERDQSFFDGKTRSALWLANNFNVNFAGKPALNYLDEEGYLRGKIFRSKVFAHRVAYALYHGAAPDEIDHKNGIKSDNRIDNLREATHAQNNANFASKMGKHSIYRGVTKGARCVRFSASIRDPNEGRRIRLGSFLTQEEAARAYDAAAHRIYGEFARLNFPAALAQIKGER